MELTCYRCGKSQKIYCCIDSWSIVDKKNFCFECSKKLKIGWFEYKNKTFP